jgi:hypothetical protein
LVDATGERIEIGVLCAEDHAAVGPAGIVKVAEVLAIVRQYGSAFCMRERQHILVLDPQTCQVYLGDREYIVAELPQHYDGRVGKVLVSEEAGQRLGLLILSDLTVNLVEMSGDKRPSVDQVGRSERGKCTQNLGFS